MPERDRVAPAPPLANRALTLLGSALFGFFALLLAAMAAAGGHGSYLPAKLLFPLSMLSTLVTESISPVAIALALAQYPLCALYYLFGASKGRTRARLLQLAGIHALLATLAVLVLSGGSFP